VGRSPDRPTVAFGALRTLGLWTASIVGFLAAVELIWPTPAGVVIWSAVFGSIIGLLAIGLALTYRSHRVINFAQADLGAVPATLVVSLVVVCGWSYWAAVPVGLGAAVVLGSVVELLIIRRFKRAPRLILMVATIGLAQLLSGVSDAIPRFFGAVYPPTGLPQPFTFNLEVWPMLLHANDLIAVVTTIVAVAGLFFFLKRTNVGVALRASAESSDRASLLGVNVGFVHNIAWIITTVLAAIAMILRAGVLGLALGPAFAPSILLRALAAAVIGRMRNLPVIFAAACAIGILETAILWNEGSTNLVDPALFLVLLGVLLLQRRHRDAAVDTDSVSTWEDAARVRPVPRELARLPEVRWARRVLLVMVAGALVALPAFLDDRYTNLAAAVVIYAIIAVSLVLLTGWAGEISLGQMAFVAIGSAAAGVADVHWHVGPLGCFLLAGVVGALASVVIGVPALRIRGLMLSVTTLAFGVATSSYLLDRQYFSFLPDNLIDRVARRPLWTPLGSVSIASETRFYFVCLAGLGLVVLAVHGLRRSRVERDVVATRDNDRAAQAFRVSPARAKLLAFGLSGFFASFAGGLLALHQQAIGQQIFEPVESLRVLTMVVVGGLASVPGAILGAVFLKSTEWFNVIVPEQYRYLFTFAGSGVGILLVLWLLPGGFGSVLYAIRDWWLRAVARRRGIVVPSLVTGGGDTSAVPTSVPIAAPQAVGGILGANGDDDRAPRPLTRTGRTLARRTVLSLQGVDVSYGHVQALYDVTMNVREGETVALLGTNGAGKSTVLRAASGLVSPQRGRVVLGERDITRAAPHRIAARGLVHVPAGNSVFPSLTVSDNLRMGAWMFRRNRARVARETARVLELFPGLRDRLDDPAAALSGGQQRMLALAMALLPHPTVLMIDELSLGLAPLVVEELLDVVRRLRADGITVILVEQSANTALRVANRAFFLEKGRVRFYGHTSELLHRRDLLRSIFLAGATDAVRERAPAAAAGNGHDTTCDTTQPPEIVLRATGLTKRFGGVTALDGVSVEVRAREILGVIGPNGAGKTTLFDLVSGFLTPDSGDVALDGVPVTRLRPPARARRGLSRSFQDARLFSALTAYQTVCIALDDELRFRDPVEAALALPNVARSERRVGRRADELIEMMGIGDARDKFVSELSTGNRRIVDLTCQLAAEPRVILLDEPSAGIAQREAEALGPLLLLLRDLTGAGLVLIEHDLRLVTSVADRIMALDLGREIITGDPDAVIAHPRLIEAYLGEPRETLAEHFAVPSPMGTLRDRTGAAR
jgi:ABC-type branched-subunit amino acid transport system ATPase component/ABC-type branched-subunit amino acid transport system permease subunit